MVLQPQANFTVVRQIANHLDTDTNFVRAIVRNASTDVIIATLNLTDQGGQRFTKNWQVPGDPSGQGFYISIVTSVYTTSAYTTKNPNYGDEETTYLVQERVLPPVRGAGGGGIDAGALLRIIQSELGKLPKPQEVEMPVMPEMKFGEVLAGIDKLHSAISTIPTERPDMQPLLSAVGDVHRSVKEKEVTPPTDVSGVERALSELTARVGQVLTLLQTSEDKTANDVAKKISDTFSSEVLSQLESALKGTTFSLGPSTATMNIRAGKESQDNQPVKSPVQRLDISKLAL